MWGFFSPVAKWVKKKKCVIDNTTFRLHYQVTFALLIACSLLTTARQYFGDPISCITDPGMDGKVFETYCWMTGTFTLPYLLTGKQGQDFAHPGVGPYRGRRSSDFFGTQNFHMGVNPNMKIQEIKDFVDKNGDKINEKLSPLLENHIMEKEPIPQFMEHFSDTVRKHIPDFDSAFVNSNKESTSTSKPMDAIKKYVQKSMEKLKKKEEDLLSKNDPGYLRTDKNGDEIRHAWYQWVCFILFLQAVLCYIPRYIWKNWEGGKIAMLVQGLDAPMLENDPSTHEDRRSLIVKYMMKNLHKNNLYAIKFFTCEFLNFINIVGQMYLMDTFLGGLFSTYGTDVLNIVNDEDARVDPMARTFPKMAKCTFHKYGPSGTIQLHDGLCILPLNIINEKIFIVLWFWYIALAIWTGIFLCYRITTVASSQVRYLLFCNRSKGTRPMDVAEITNRLWLGDWIILMQLAKNINGEVFNDLVGDLRESIDPKRRDNIEMKDSGNGTPTAPDEPIYSNQQ